MKICGINRTIMYRRSPDQDFMAEVEMLRKMEKIIYVPREQFQPWPGKIYYLLKGNCLSLCSFFFQSILYFKKYLIILLDLLIGTLRNSGERTGRTSNEADWDTTNFTRKLKICSACIQSNTAYHRKKFSKVSKKIITGVKPL